MIAKKYVTGYTYIDGLVSFGYSQHAGHTTGDEVSVAHRVASLVKDSVFVDANQLKGERTNAWMRSV